MKDLKSLYFKVILWKSKIIEQPEIPASLLNDEKFFKGFSNEKILDFISIRAIKYDNAPLTTQEWKDEIAHLHKTSHVEILRFMRLFKVKGGFVPSPREKAKIIEMFPELKSRPEAYEDFLAKMVKNPEQFREKIREVIIRESAKPLPKKETDSLYNVFFKIVFATDYDDLLDTPKFEVVSDAEWTRVLNDLKHNLYFINEEEVRENLQADIDIDTLITTVGGAIIGFGIEEAIMGGKLVWHANEERKDLDPSTLIDFVISTIHTKVNKGELTSVECSAASSKGFRDELHDPAKEEKYKCHAAKVKASRSNIAKDYGIV